MKSISQILVLCALLFAVSFSAHAQQSRKAARIGFLTLTSASGSAHLLDVFRQELNRLGWAEGKNLTIENRFAEQKFERLSELAENLVRLRVDVLVVQATPAAKAATSTIPIVMTNSGDPVSAGLVASLARPGGNVTGFVGLAPELNAKRLEILKDTIPKLERVAFLRTREGSDMTDQQLRAAAPALKLQLEEIDTPLDAKSVEGAFETAKRKQVGAIIAPPFLLHRKRIVELAGKYALPAIYPNRQSIDEGGLMFYGVDFDDLFRRTAGYVDKILKGAKPGDLPVQQATKFEFIVNLKAAKQINLTIPPNVLARADRVIK